MQRVLIGGGDAIFNSGLAEQLEAQYAVQTADNGARVLEMIHQFEPDALCVDLHMEKMDSIAVIRNVRLSGRNIPIIVVASSVEERTVAELEQLRVDLICLKPQKVDHLANLIRGAMFVAENARRDQLYLEDMLDLMLRDLGFRMGPERYNLLRCAILAKYNQPTGMLMKNIYLDIASAFGMQYTNVEKAIRDAIKAAWRNGDTNAWQLYFPEDKEHEHCPTNEEFITTTAVQFIKEGRRRKAFQQDKVKI